MATSPIYSWPEPDNTDLVKNGALAIRTLGDAIDTTMGTMVAKTIIDAKGDLIAGTAADTAQRLAVGNNGETLVADSAATTGLRYQGNFAAGKNKIINGDFGIWQRGTSFSATGSSTYTADRWTVNAFGGTTTVSRQTFTPGTAPVAGYEGSYFLRFASSATFADLIQKVEDVRTFAGQTVTISFWAKAASSLTLTPTLSQEFGSGGSGAVDTAGTAASVTTSWTRFTATVAVPSISGKTIGTGSSLWLYFLSSTLNTNIDIWGIQLEAGSVATAFNTATGTIQGELAACQRYYYVLADANSQSFGTCAYFTATDILGTVFYPVTMRTTPTFAAASGAYYEVVRNGAADALSGLQANFLTTRTANIFADSGNGASGTAGNGGQYRTSSASANIAFSAEL